MKYKLFEEYNEEQNNGHPGFLKSKEEIYKWLQKYDRNYYINTYTINDDWSVDVKGDVDIWKKDLNYIRVRFNVVKGGFECSNNQLTTLKGAPQKVVGSFACGDNNLTTLEHAPDVVEGYFFYCGDNETLVTLGYKSDIKGDFRYSELQGTLGERWKRYINYLNTLDEDDKKSSLQWLYDVDEDFRELVVRYAAYNDIDLPGVNMDIATDASKHKDSGLF